MLNDAAVTIGFVEFYHFRFDVSTNDENADNKVGESALIRDGS